MTTTHRSAKKPHGNFVHGGQGTKEHKAWANMWSRCRNKNLTNYKDYGGRGIKVCERWKKFLNFLEDMGYAPTPKHEIDRKNVNGNYSKRNCKWVTHKQNSRNQRKTTRVRYRGQIKSVSEWCEELGLRRRTVAWRIAHGIKPKDAFK